MAGKIAILIFMNLLVLVSAKRLVQVVMLSRHNIRAPLIEKLELFSPNPWPVWSYKPGYLTAKGALLEEYMGEYIKDWLKKEKLFGESCPVQNEIHIYGNTRQRTRESAKAFARGAFKNCNVTVYVINSDDMDPVFNPVIRNASSELKNEIIKEMQQKLDDLKLNDAYLELENILDLKTSHSCKHENVCSFVNVKDDIFYEIGEEPGVVGPLGYSNSIVDSFLMSYYEGMPIYEVAWGKIKTPDQWKSLTKITKENQKVRFNSTILAKEVGRPLLEYITSLFVKENPPKFTLLHGHDSNLNSVMAAIGVKSFVLPDQYETTPLGGKLVLQKWHDEDSNRDFLKVDYVYQSVNQLREGTKLSEENSPRWAQLEIKECPIDENGFCLWEKFVKILSSLIN